jgi:cathepsin A (carboxypeptidase C)
MLTDWFAYLLADEKIQLGALKDHSLRISPTKSTLCEPSVKQHSGYLDVTDGKHLFFWYFEARESPADKPLVLWYASFMA